jgi:very-short-patch-repair endonuclease
LEGHKFVRQASIGPFIADFVSRDRKLIVEVDGETHSTEDELARDARRTAYLRREGYRIIRFWNSDVIEAMDGVIVKILAALSNDNTSSPACGGGRGPMLPKAHGGGEGH